MAQTIRDVQKGRGHFRPPMNRPHPHFTRTPYVQRKPTLVPYLWNTHCGQAHTSRMPPVQRKSHQTETSRYII